MREKWKDIVGLEGQYQISSLGRVKSLERTILCDRNGKKYPKRVTGRILKLAINGQGYRYFNTYNKILKKSVLKRVHRLVAEHFIPNKDNKPCVNHVDGNKNNNDVSNLEWCTYSENMLHSYENKLHAYKNNLNQGEKHGESKLTEKQVLEIRKIYDKRRTTNKKLGKKYGVSPSNISCIVTRKSWKHV